MNSHGKKLTRLRH